MNHYPLVSVILPVYNSAEYLGDCIQSILEQTYTNFELLICDDCSTDESYQIILSKQASDPRIKTYKNGRNLGISGTQNLLIEKASGIFLAIMNSDDLIVKDKLEQQVYYFSNHPEVDLLGGDIDLIYNGQIISNKQFKSLKLTDKEIKDQLEYATAIDHVTLMGKTYVFKALKYDENLPAAVDYDFQLRAKLAGYKFNNLSSILCHYRIHESSTGSKNRTKQLKGAYLAYLRYKGKIRNIEKSDFLNSKYLGERLFLKVSSLKREDSVVTAIARTLISPFSGLGRYCLRRKLLMKLKD